MTLLTPKRSTQRFLWSQLSSLSSGYLALRYEAKDTPRSLIKKVVGGAIANFVLSSLNNLATVRIGRLSAGYVVHPAQFARIRKYIDLVNKHDCLDSYCVLLHGRPGTGKTFYGELAKMQIRDTTRFTSEIEYVQLEGLICNVNLERHSAPASNSFNVTVIDEIDRIVDSEKSKALLLSKIDQLKRQRPGIIILTTNNFEEIDPVVYRDGRVDEILEIQGFTANEVSTYANAHGYCLEELSLRPIDGFYAPGSVYRAVYEKLMAYPTKERKQNGKPC